MTNHNPTTGIAYGTIYGHECPVLMNEIFDCGEDESFKAYKAQCIKEMTALLEEHGQTRNAEDNAKDIVDNYEWDNYECDEPDYSYTDPDGNQFLMSYLGGAPLIWCIKTDNITHARLCSPCVPGAGDLSAIDPDGIECYDIPKCIREAIADCAD